MKHIYNRSLLRFLLGGMFVALIALFVPSTANASMNINFGFGYNPGGGYQG